MTPRDFILKWRNHALTERAAAHEHFFGLCKLVEHPTPAEVDPQSGLGGWAQKGIPESQTPPSPIARQSTLPARGRDESVQYVEADLVCSWFEKACEAVLQNEGVIGLQDTVILMLRSAHWARLEARTSFKQVV